MTKLTTLEVQWITINVVQNDFISLTDIARLKNLNEPKDVVKNRMRLKNTIEFLWLRESINNQFFKGVEFDSFIQDAWSNVFTLSPQKWIEHTKAIWIVSKSWKNGWTFAHKDIAVKFAWRISVEFELYLIKEFQRLKEQESKSLDRNVKRFLTKINYKIHTDSIKENLIPKQLTKQEISFVYADEADVLNKSLFGKTAKEWRDENQWKNWNIRDHANIEQLIILANIESMNAQFIKMWVEQSERLEMLNNVAITQMKSLFSVDMDRLTNN